MNDKVKKNGKKILVWGLIAGGIGFICGIRGIIRLANRRTEDDFECDGDCENCDDSLPYTTYFPPGNKLDGKKN